MAASAEQIQEVLRRAKHSNPTIVAAKIVERLQQPHLQADVVTTRTKSRLMVALVSQLLPLIAQIAQYNKEINTLFLTHEDHVMNDNINSRSRVLEVPIKKEKPRSV